LCEICVLKPALKEFQVLGLRTIDGRPRYTQLKGGKAFTVMYRKRKQIQICNLIGPLNAVQVYHHDITKRYGIRSEFMVQ